MSGWKQTVVIITCLSCYTCGQFASEDAINAGNYSRLQLWIDQICINYTDPTRLIAVISEDPHADYYGLFMRNFQRPIMLYDYRTHLHSLALYQKPDMYLIFLAGDNLGNMLIFLRSLDTWHPQAKIVICYQGSSDQNLVYLENIIQLLYHSYIFNVVIVTLDLEAYTYDPYKLENFNEPDLGIVQLGSLPSNMFFNKIPLVWRNSVARVHSVFLKPYVISVEDKFGMDMDVMETLGKKMGLSLKYNDTHNYNWGIRNANGSYSHVLGVLQRGEGEFANGHFHFREVEAITDFDYTFSYANDPLIWAVPCPVPVSNWAGLILIFAQDTWLGVLVVLALSAVIWQVIGRLLERGYFATWYAIEVPFLLFLALSISTDPKRTSARLMYICSWLFGFILTTSWLSSLTASLTHVQYEAPIRSVSEIFQRGLVLGIHPELALMYATSDDAESKFIAHNNIACDLSGGCWERVSYQKDMATVTTVRILRYITYDRYMSDKGERLMVRIEASSNINVDYTTMYFVKGHPFGARTDQLLWWIFEGGFIDYFDINVNFKQAITERRNIFDPNKLETKMLNMEQLLSPFAVLIVGLLMETVIFLGELCKYYLLSPIKADISGDKLW